MNRKRPGVSAVIIVVAALVIVIGIIVFPIIIVGTYLGGGLDKATGLGGPSGYGCFVSDDAFLDTSVTTNKESIISQITTKYPNAKTNESYLREVFDRGEKEGINPLIPLAIWAGEQTFANPEKAFGYGYTDSGTLEGVTGWEAQLNGVFSRIKLTVNNSAPYNKPVEGNRFTRLFYNYTTAMKVVYEASGNTWDEEAKYSDGSQPVKARLAVFHLVAQDQITCQARTLVAGARTGNDGVPLYKQADYPQPYGSSTIAASGCCTVSAAMVLNYYNLGVDPIIISNLAAANGFYIAGQGTDHSGFYSFLTSRYPLKLTNLGTDWGQAIKQLKDKKPIIARGAGAEPYTTSGHCIVITGYDEKTQMVRVNNPASGDGPYPLNQLKRQTTVLYFLGQ
ncbi:MAG: C39 family peptidase [Patescibacteria group bacterium]